MDARTRSLIDAAWCAIWADLELAGSLIALIDSFPGLMTMTHNISEAAEYVAVSQGFTELVGWTQEEIKELGLLGLSFPEDLQLLAEIEPKLRAGPWQGIRYRWKCKGGGHVWFEWEGTEYSSDGHILCVGKVVDGPLTS